MRQHACLLTCLAARIFNILFTVDRPIVTSLRNEAKRLKRQVDWPVNGKRKLATNSNELQPCYPHQIRGLAAIGAYRSPTDFSDEA
jgi:hypothetical protein